MSEHDKPYITAAISAVDALRLFVSVMGRSDTQYDSSRSGAGLHLSEAIKFRADACRGKLTRNDHGITLTVIPDPDKAPDFIPRTLIFERNAFAGSMLMDTPSAEFLMHGGRDFCRAFAALLSDRHPGGNLIPFPYDGEHLLLINATAGSADARETVEQLVQGIDASSASQIKCLIGYPAIDLPAQCFLINNEGQIFPPNEQTSKRFAAVSRAAQLLPTALRFTQSGAGYPLPYKVLPHRFTLEGASDPSLAHTRGIFAEARAAVLTGETDLLRQHSVKVSLPSGAPDRSTDVCAIALTQLLDDWEAVMGREAKPKLLRHNQIQDATHSDQTQVQIIVLAEPDAAYRYNELGRYHLLIDRY